MDGGALQAPVFENCTVMTKVFVGNFSFSVDDTKLREYFAKVGTVISAKVMTEGQGGRSRGFGFVELTSPEEASKAIAELDGSVWEGRVIKVSEDRSNRRQDNQGPQIERGMSGGSDFQRGEPRGDRGGATGYFRAQPLDLGTRRRRKIDPFMEDPKLAIDYKDAKLLSRFMSERGRVLPRRMTGLTAYHQRQITRAIKRAQHLALLPAARS